MPLLIARQENNFPSKSDLLHCAAIDSRGVINFPDAGDISDLLPSGCFSEESRLPSPSTGKEGVGVGEGETRGGRKEGEWGGGGGLLKGWVERGGVKSGQGHSGGFLSPSPSLSFFFLFFFFLFFFGGGGGRGR